MAAALLLAAAFLAGCPAQDGVTDAGGGDRGGGEGISLPDLGPGDAWVVTGNIGAPCVPGNAGDCTGAAKCMRLTDKLGICSVPGCRPEVVTTPAREDNCPAIPNPGDGGATLPTVCTYVPILGTYHCLPGCKPSTTTNPCEALHPGVTCDPVSILYTHHREVCLFPRCTSDLDCGNQHPFQPDSTCHKSTGTCRGIGTKGAAVGDPCKSFSDCGPGQYCYPESRDAAGKVHLEGGYCTVVGCAYGAPWTCPAGSRCFTLGGPGATSLCLATGCDPSAPEASDGCRDKASTGQYDCFFLDKSKVCWVRSK